MNIRKAKKQSELNNRTWGQLLAVVMGANKDGMSTLNPNITKREQAEKMRDKIEMNALFSIPSDSKHFVEDILREFGR